MTSQSKSGTKLGSCFKTSVENPQTFGNDVSFLIAGLVRPFFNAS
jgi:hypothetical protein